MSGITRDDWLQAVKAAELASAPPADASVVTLHEFCDLVGVSRGTAITRLRAMVHAGTVTRCKKLYTRTDGIRVMVSAYRLEETTTDAAPQVDSGRLRDVAGRDRAVARNTRTVGSRSRRGVKNS